MGRPILSQPGLAHFSCLLVHIGDNDFILYGLASTFFSARGITYEKYF